MPNVTVTNTNPSPNPISVLGLGPVQYGATKSGYIAEAQFAPHARAYRTKAPALGLVVLEAGMSNPDGVQTSTTTATVAAGTTLSLCDSSGGTYVHTLRAASAYSDGDEIVFYNKGSANQVTLTRASSDYIGDGSDTTYALTTTVRRVKLRSNGFDRWTIVTD